MKFATTLLNHKTRINFSILIFIFLHNSLNCQIDPASLVAGKFLQKHIEWYCTIEKLKSMSTLQGNNTVNAAYNNAKQEVNSYYDKSIQKVKNDYALSIEHSNPKTQEGELYQAKRYKILMEKISKIEIRKSKDLSFLKKQHDDIIRIFSKYWSKNDLNSKMIYVR